MTREEVFSLIQNHLADELDIDPSRIDESTHFKNDLEAGCADVATANSAAAIAQSSDEQAAKIQTVGAAVDFVLDHGPVGA